MPISAPAAVDRLAREGRVAESIDLSLLTKAEPCRCESRRIFEPDHCHKCGRDLRWLGLAELELLEMEAYERLGAVIEIARRDLNLMVQEQTGSASFIDLMRETYWLADALREDWTPA